MPKTNMLPWQLTWINNRTPNNARKAKQKKKKKTLEALGMRKLTHQIKHMLMFRCSQPVIFCSPKRVHGPKTKSHNIHIDDLPAIPCITISLCSSAINKRNTANNDVISVGNWAILRPNRLQNSSISVLVLL